MDLGGASNSRDGHGQAAAGRQEELPPTSNNNHQLPRSGIVRTMRRVLAANVNISSPAKNLTQYCATEFIIAVADEAARRSGQDQRRMLTPEDVAWSLRSLGLDRFVEPMGTYLRRYREAASGAGQSGSSRAPAAGDPTDEELMQILAQTMNGAGGNNGS